MDAHEEMDLGHPSWGESVGDSVTERVKRELFLADLAVRMQPSWRRLFPSVEKTRRREITTEIRSCPACHVEAARIRVIRRVSGGTACAPRISGAPDLSLHAFIPDDQEICDYCLLAQYDLLNEETYDGCGDPLAMCPLYPREAVLAALRRHQNAS